jgi:uncharacterized protein
VSRAHLVALVCLLLPIFASAQDLQFRAPADNDPAALDRAMVDLARQVMAAPERRTGTSAQDLIWVQTAAGWYSEAQAIVDAGRPKDAQFSNPSMAPVELYVRAKVEESQRPGHFEAAFAQSFKQTVEKLDNPTAFATLPWFTPPPLERSRTELYALIEKHRSAERITLLDALELCRRYVLVRVYEAIGPLSAGLIDADNARRYNIDDVLIKTPDDASINAIVVRPKDVSRKLPTVLEFTIYTYPWSTSTAMKFASRGYVGVVGFTRGKRSSPDPVVPYERDGDDARALIDWISKQPWSDGRVGMHGGSYNGFTQWAAVKRLHPALKTIVPYCPVNPGFGLPMNNNVFLTANYAWAFYTTSGKNLDEALYADSKRWSELPWKWYRSGRSYREIDQVDGQPNPWLQRWLQHPGYDQYWQGMTANGRDYAGLMIPVLAIDGYFDDGQNDAVRRLQEHYKHRPNAEHYLVIGPYDHFGSRMPVKPELIRGYKIDPVAQLDTQELAFQWFDYVFKGAPKPSLLKDKINYQVMGGNVWKHAPSIEAMSDESRTWYLTSTRELASDKPAKAAQLEMTVNFADRTTASADTYPSKIITTDIGAAQGLVFATEPFDAPVSVTGLFNATLRFISNKKDLDIALVLYEAMPDGTFFHLSYTVARASYARDMSKRSLLTPGAIQTVTLDNTLLVSRQLGKGSRLLLVLDVNRNPYAQVNHGTGKDVSEESIADATEPLQIQWLTDSHITVPMSR